MRSLLVCLLLIATADMAHAVLKVRLIAKRTSFLLYEPAHYIVEVHNDGPRQVTLQNDPKTGRPWLSFLILKGNNARVRPDAPFKPNSKVLAPGEKVNLAVNITPYYQVRESANYEIQAIVRGPSGPPMVSGFLPFNVTRGYTWWSQTREIGTTKRSYSLVRYKEKKTHLYVRIEEPDTNIVYGTFHLGIVIPNRDPQIDFDNEGNMHVIHQLRSRRYMYSKISPVGHVLKQEERSSGNSLPQLVRNQEGAITLAGGLSPKQAKREKLSELQVPGNARLPSQAVLE